jgi:hypothetical protein
MDDLYLCPIFYDFDINSILNVVDYEVRQDTFSSITLADPDSDFIPDTDDTHYDTDNSYE